MKTLTPQITRKILFRVTRMRNQNESRLFVFSACLRSRLWFCDVKEIEQRSISVATTHLHPGVGDMLVQFIMVQHHESITCVVKLSTNKQEARNNRFGRCSAWKSVR